jgi:hypothetical protein
MKSMYGGRKFMMERRLHHCLTIGNLKLWGKLAWKPDANFKDKHIINHVQTNEKQYTSDTISSRK